MSVWVGACMYRSMVGRRTTRQRVREVVCGGCSALREVVCVHERLMNERTHNCMMSAACCWCSCLSQVNLLLDSQTPPTSTLLPQEQQPNQQPCNQHQQQSQQACHTSAAATAAEAAAAAAAVHNHCVGMEVDDLSQQMSTRMSISESGGSLGALLRGI